MRRCGYARGNGARREIHRAQPLRAPIRLAGAWGSREALQRHGGWPALPMYLHLALTGVARCMGRRWVAGGQAGERTIPCSRCRDAALFPARSRPPPPAVLAQLAASRSGHGGSGEQPPRRSRRRPRSRHRAFAPAAFTRAPSCPVAAPSAPFTPQAPAPTSLCCPGLAPSNHTQHRATRLPLASRHPPSVDGRRRFPLARSDLRSLVFWPSIPAHDGKQAEGRRKPACRCIVVVLPSLPPLSAPSVRPASSAPAVDP